MCLPAFGKGCGDLLLHIGGDIACPGQARSPVSDDDESRRIADLVFRGRGIERVVSPGKMLEGSLGDLGVPLRVIRLEGPELQVQVAVGDAGDPRQEATGWRLAGGALLEQRLLDGTLDQADERIAGETASALKRFTMQGNPPQ